MRAIKCCSVVFGVKLKLLVISISLSFPAINKHCRLLPAKCHNLRHGGPTASYWQRLAGSSINSKHWSQILAQNRDFCLPHLYSRPPLGGFPSEYCHAVWYRKTRMVWLPDSENILKIRLFVLTECTNVTDTQTDRQTDTAWRHRPRLHSIARQKLQKEISGESRWLSSLNFVWEDVRVLTAYYFWQGGGYAIGAVCPPALRSLCVHDYCKSNQQISLKLRRTIILLP